MLNESHAKVKSNDNNAIINQNVDYQDNFHIVSSFVKFLFMKSVIFF